MKINVKTFAGVGVGLVVGYFLFKSSNKKYLKIGAIGLAGGVLANLIQNHQDKKNQAISTEKYIEQAQDEMTASLTGNEKMIKEPFDIASVNETSPKDYFDIDLSHN
jgi:N-acetyl-gamma-glutamylphosphate reductase